MDTSSVTLEQLREFAQKHKDREFDTGRGSVCLIASYLREDRLISLTTYIEVGKYCGYKKSEDEYDAMTSIPILTPVNYERELGIKRRKEGYRLYSGQELVEFIDSLIQAGLTA